MINANAKVKRAVYMRSLDWEAIQRAVLEAIRLGHTTLRQIEKHVGYDSGVVNRGLQGLRKMRRIRYASKDQGGPGWKIVGARKGASGAGSHT